MAADHLIANIGAEHLTDLLPEILAEAARSVAGEAKPAGKPLAVVVHMTLFAHNWPAHSVRSQVEAAFPGVPMIFVDSGTNLQVIHAAE